MSHLQKRYGKQEIPEEDEEQEEPIEGNKRNQQAQTMQKGLITHSHLRTKMKKCSKCL